tara:strand:+ start:44390 stop:44719 length:330 start_codon:yes stop_codon:yes gene_type:complete
MASYGVNKVVNIYAVEFRDTSGASSSYSYTCPAGKRAEVSLGVNASSSASGSYSTEVLVKGISVFSDTGACNFSKGMIYLNAGESVSITNELSSGRAARGFINALEYEA